MSTLRVERVADDVIADDVRRVIELGRLGKHPGTVPEPELLTIGEPEFPERVQTGGGIPLAPVAAIVLALLGLVGGGIALGLFGGVGATPTPMPSPSPTLFSTPPPAVATPTATLTPTPLPSPAALVFPPNTVFDGCIVIDPQGNTTVLAAAFTVFNVQGGDYRAAFAQTPTGALAGSGTATAGQNPVVVPMRATRFGTYDGLSITTPGGMPVALGPIASQVPLDINAATNVRNDCDPAALLMPTQQALAGREYLAAVAPVNAAQVDFFAIAVTWTEAISPETAQADAAELLAALRAVHVRLQALALAYPPAGVQLDAADRAVLALIEDLENLSRIGEIGVAAWRQDYEADLAQLTAASRGVRNALGLPAPLGTPTPAP